MSDDAGMREAKRRGALVAEGKFDQALESLGQAIAKRPRDSLVFRERAHLYLYLGRFREARADLDMTAELEAVNFHTRAGRLHSEIELNAIGVTYWAEGHKELALAFWRYATASLHAGQVAYAHQGGGIETGLLLWFGAVQAQREDDVELVRKFYEKRLASTHWAHSLKGWPGPIVHFFLEHIGDDELLRSAKHPQEQCQAHFAVSIRARSQRRYAAAKKHLQSAGEATNGLDLYDFYNVWPFFLARVETAT